MNFSKLFSCSGSSLFLVLLLISGCTSLEPSRPKAAEKTEATDPPTYTVSRSPAKPKVQVDAVFEAVEMAPVKVEPKGWADLSVLEAVPHGARVKKGEVLVKLDLDKLKEQIEDLEQDRPAAILALELATAELENLQQTTDPKLEAARRTRRVADEDLAYFEKIGRAQREKSAEFSVKNAEQRLEGAQEELKQLEKMYKADDLVEDTEEIILKRSKFALESAQYGLETTKQSTTWSLKTGIPREEETLKASKRDQDLALVLAEQALPRNLTKKRYDVEKLKRDQKKAEKKLAELKKDLAVLSSIEAPISGVLYYGACEAGRWTTGAAVSKKLIPSGKLGVNEVFMTIANPDKLILRAVIQEAEVANCKTGMEGKAAPVLAPDKKLTVKLEELGAIPLPTGGFEARFSVPKTGGLRIMPGMNCKVSIGEAGKSEALQVPKDAVFKEESDNCVYIFKQGSAPEKRTIKTGESDGKLIEILQGLSEGEKILLSKPK